MEPWRERIVPNMFVLASSSQCLELSVLARALHVAGNLDNEPG